MAKLSSRQRCILVLISSVALHGFAVQAQFDLAGLTKDAGATLQQMQSFRRSNHVWMSPVEQGLIEAYLQSNHTMLEWGSGYSTLWFSQFVNRYYSIEHHQGWYSQVREELDKHPNIDYRLAHVPDGHKGWKGGYDEGTAEQFASYISAVDQFEVPTFDRVLIDGRARADCAVHVLKYLKPSSIVFIHDYQNRHFYHSIVNPHYQQVAAAFEDQSLYVFRPRLSAIPRR